MIEKDLLERLDFSDDDKAYILKCDSIVSEQIEDLAEEYWKTKQSFPHFINKVRKTSKDIPSYTLDLLFILHLTSFLKIEYDKRHIPDNIYWDTVMDIKYKCDECKAVKNTVGTFVVDWFEGFFALTRFALGRLQFDILNSNEKITVSQGNVKKGDLILSCHIPSGSKLRYNDCIESYKKAYEFLNGKFEGNLAIICISWLLYPDYKAVFNNCPNTKRFIEDYKIYKVKTQKTFEDVWRVFSTDDYKDIKNLPDKTTMQKAFINHIANKGKFGFAFGILFFDGEKIVKL